MTGGVWLGAVTLSLANLVCSIVALWYTSAVCRFRTSALTTSLFLFSLALVLSAATQSVVYMQMARSQPESIALLVSLPTTAELVALLLFIKTMRV